MSLFFTPYAFAKLIFFRDKGPTEISGMGITDIDQLNVVKDIKLIKQSCTSITTEFDDTAIADFFEDMVDAGYHPKQFGRVWIHTHPGNSASPSNTDEETFAKAFGKCDHAIMAILARGGESYARLQIANPMRVVQKLSVHIAYNMSFPGSDHEAWAKEYSDCVTEQQIVQNFAGGGWTNNGDYQTWAGAREKKPATSVATQDEDDALEIMAIEQALNTMGPVELQETLEEAEEINDTDTIEAVKRVIRNKPDWFRKKMQEHKDLVESYRGA